MRPILGNTAGPVPPDLDSQIVILPPCADAPDFLGDPARLAALHEAGLLDGHGGVTGGEAFDGLTRTAARLLAVPLACVTLLTDERQLVASAGGPDAAALVGANDPACDCFCRYVVGRADRFVVDDARTHPLVQDSAAVREGRVAAYAGVPLATREGHVLGSFCVVDRAPRRWTREEIEVLTDLADAAAAKLELTRALRARDRELAEQEARLRAALEARRITELQLQHAQKLDALGRLAGGVAHDFNNVLAVISSYAQLLLGDLGADDPRAADAQEIVHAARRGARLTRQLLGFSSPHARAPELLDVVPFVQSFEPFLRRLLGGEVVLATSADGPGGCVHADRGQLEQVLMNLVVNARDAMPGGGTVWVRSEGVTLDAEAAGCALPVISPGRYVALAVSDEGQGMDDATRARVLEPFFTTKEPGKGTGLGLSTVYGIVAAASGAIHIDSTPGAGTTVTVYLPFGGDAQAPDDDEADAPGPCGSHAATYTTPAGGLAVVSGAVTPAGTVLVVDDDPGVLVATARLLRGAGYRVMTAAGGEEALGLASWYDGEIDVLFTDVVMPSMHGMELARWFREVRPRTGVLFTSGHATEAVRLTRPHPEDAVGAEQLLEKPVTPAALLAAVQEIVRTRAA